MMNAKLPTQNFDARNFLWEGKLGLADASGLDLPPGQWPNVIRVTSHKTGVVKGFVFGGFDANGRARYNCSTDSNLALLIFND